ncbi:MAG: hypothetical protein ABSB69_20140 [Solirubrobacteraceae bacterium]
MGDDRAIAHACVFVARVSLSALHCGEDQRVSQFSAVARLFGATDELGRLDAECAGYAHHEHEIRFASATLYCAETPWRSIRCLGSVGYAEVAFFAYLSHRCANRGSAWAG